MMDYFPFTFHRAPTGSANGYKQLLEAQAAGGFVSCMTVDNYGPAGEALAIARAAGADHFICWRPKSAGARINYDFDVPGRNYTETVANAAANYINALLSILPPEFDPAVRIVVFNEPDKNRLDYVALVSAEIARRFEPLGLRGVFLNLNAGEPEPDQWRTGPVLNLLRMIEKGGRRHAVGLHEYGLSKDPLADRAPWWIGRFAFLREACQDNGIVFGDIPIALTEFGHGRDIFTWPGLTRAQADQIWAAGFYGDWPNIRMIAWWILSSNPEWKGIGNEVEKLIPYLTARVIEQGRANEWPQTQPPPPPPPVKHKAIVVIAPQEIEEGQWLDIAKYAYDFRHTVTASHDDALTILKGGRSDSYVKIVFSDLPSQAQAIGLIEAAGYSWIDVTPQIFDTQPEQPWHHNLQFSPVFTSPHVVTSRFDAARDYGKHEGVDLDIVGGPADSKEPVRCIFEGVVTYAGYKPNAYGHRVITRCRYNGVDFDLWYCHLDATFVTAGQRVQPNTPLGELGGTGPGKGAFAEHVHINMQVPGRGLPGYVIPDVIDPLPFMSLVDPPPAQTIDILPYICPAGDRQYIMKNGGDQERYRPRAFMGGHLIQKNGEGEWYTWDNDFIYLRWDTTPNADEYYIRSKNQGSLNGSPYLPRRMAVGRGWTHVENHYVAFYWKDTKRNRDKGRVPCANSKSLHEGQARQSGVLLARYAVYTTPYGAVYQDVIAISTGSESQYYAHGIGRIGWESSWGSAWATPENVGNQTSEPLLVSSCLLEKFK